MTPAMRAPDDWIGEEPVVLIFDVNETLIDLRGMDPVFERIFGDPGVLRHWFGELITYSMALSLSGLWSDWFSLGGAMLKMVGATHGRTVTDADVEAIMLGMRTMPAHPDVAEGLRRLKADGFRLVTLTNSSLPKGGAKSPLEHAGLGDLIERQFSVESVRGYKPASRIYHYVAQELGVREGNCLLAAAHMWDTIGAQAAGCSAALITRPGNAPFALPGIPYPTLVVADLLELADALQRRWR